MTARDEVLAAARSLEQQGFDRFTVGQIEQELDARDVNLPHRVVEMLVTSAMCLYAHGSSRVRYDDFVQVGRDRYRVADSAGGDPVVGPPQELTEEELARGRFTLEVEEAVNLIELLTDYRPVMLHAAVEEYGALTAAKRVLMDDEPSDGFDVLRDRSRLDLTVEWKALKYPILFSRAERRIAHGRLDALGAPVDDWLHDRLGRQYP